jgi:hypothetical protein
MELFETINGQSQNNDVHYGELKDGRIVIKYDLNKKYFKVVTREKFDEMCEEAKAIGAEVSAIKLTN